MRKVRASAVSSLAEDILAELTKMRQLESQIRRVQIELESDPTRADLLNENFALKLHNFYSGCERIFQLVAVELNGGLPSGNDWHRRLLDRMQAEREGRPAVISGGMASKLQEYLGFRHVVRSLYGYELDPDRIAKLVNRYPGVWHQFEREIQVFIEWLRSLAVSLEQ
jgi:hypothetical protein